jgi:MFS family permease
LTVWVSLLPQICCFTIAFFLKDPKFYTNESGNIYSHLKSALNQFTNNLKLRLLTVTASLRFAISESSYFLETAFVNLLWPVWGVGVFGMLQHLGGALGYYFSGKLISRYSALKVLLFENIINRFISFLALLFPGFLSPVLIASASFPWGAGMVAENALLQKEFSEKQRATMGSLNSFFGSIVFGIFSVILGFLADVLGVRIALLIAAVILIFPLYVYRLIFKLNKINVRNY